MMDTTVGRTFYKQHAMTREKAQSAWEKIVDIGFSDYHKLVDT
jgi:hypothetical protein